MIKYNKDMRDSILNVVRNAKKRGTGAQYVSSQADNDNYFGKIESLTICDVKPVKNKVDGQDREWNVIIFTDNHQMSATRIFDAKGLTWPVGGDEAKMSYLLDAIEAGEELTLSPLAIHEKPMQYKDKRFVVRDETTGKISAREGTPNGDKIDPPVGALMAITYEFKPYTFPKLKGEE